MHKKYFLIFLVFFFLNFISASDSQLYSSCGGDSQTIIGCVGDSQLFFSGSITQSQNPPTLEIQKPKNETYFNNDSLKIQIVTNAENSWFNIDGGGNDTIQNLKNLNATEGVHTIYVFANNSFGVTAKNVTFSINLTKFEIKKLEFSGETTNFAEFSFEECQNLSNVTIDNPGKGKIKFNEKINLTNSENQLELNLDNYVNISFNRIEIKSENIPNLNKSATLILYDLLFANPRILKDGAVCPSEICTLNGYSDGDLNFSVTGFSVYSSEESPQITGAVTSGGGNTESSNIIYECYQDSDCSKKEEYCWNHKCVKILDIKITDFESPVNLGDFFDFTYFLKGMANISGDVIIDFSIEKDSEIITAGTDTIYLGSFEEKTQTTKLFLPSNAESGVYKFKIEVRYGNYKAESSRTIEIKVKDGIAEIIPYGEGKDYRIYFIAIIIILMIIAFLKIYKTKHEEKLEEERRKGIDMFIEKANVIQQDGNIRYSHVQVEPVKKNALQKIKEFF